MVDNVEGRYEYTVLSFKNRQGNEMRVVYMNAGENRRESVQVFVNCN